MTRLLATLFVVLAVACVAAYAAPAKERGLLGNLLGPILGSFDLPGAQAILNIVNGLDSVVVSSQFIQGVKSHSNFAIKRLTTLPLPAFVFQDGLLSQISNLPAVGGVLPTDQLNPLLEQLTSAVSRVSQVEEQQPRHVRGILTVTDWNRPRCIGLQVGGASGSLKALSVGKITPASQQQIASQVASIATSIESTLGGLNLPTDSLPLVGDLTGTLSGLLSSLTGLVSVR